MIKLSIGENVFDFSENILKISGNLNDLAKSRISVDEPLPILKGDASTFKIFSDYFEKLVEIGFFDDLFIDGVFQENFFEKIVNERPDLIDERFKKNSLDECGSLKFFSNYSLSRYSFSYFRNTISFIAVPEFFDRCSLKELIDLFNLGFSLQIEILIRTVSFVISRRKMKIFWYDNTTFIEDLSSSELVNKSVMIHKVYPSHFSLTFMILNCYSKERYNDLSDDVKKNFEYCPRIICKHFKISSCFADSCFAEDLFENIINNVCFINDVEISNHWSPKALCLQNINSFGVMFGRNGFVNGFCFAGTNIRTVVIGSGCKIIGKRGFKNCKLLEQISVPKSVFRIEKEAFKGCTKLKVFCSPGVSHIHESAFDGCSNLESVIVSKWLINISSNAFRDCVKLKRFMLADDSTKSFEFTEANKCCLIPGQIYFNGRSIFQNTGFETVRFMSGTNRLVFYNENIFCDCKELTCVVFPEEIDTLGTRFFANCKNLKYIGYEENGKYCEDLPKKFDFLAVSCFEGCDNLDKKYQEQLANFNFLSDEEYQIYKHTYEGSYTITTANSTELIIPEFVKKVNSEPSYRRIMKIETLVLLNSVNEVSMRLCESWKYLKTVVLSNTLSLIPRECFRCCENLVNINYVDDSGKLHENELPPSIKRIGDNSFSCTDSLKMLKLPDLVEIIPTCAFSFSGIEKIIVSKNLFTIDDNAFSSTPNLEKICYINDDGIEVEGIPDNTAVLNTSFKDSKYVSINADIAKITKQDKKHFENDVREDEAEEDNYDENDNEEDDEEAFRW